MVRSSSIACPASRLVSWSSAFSAGGACSTEAWRRSDTAALRERSGLGLGPEGGDEHRPRDEEEVDGENLSEQRAGFHGEAWEMGSSPDIGVMGLRRYPYYQASTGLAIGSRRRGALPS